MEGNLQQDAERLDKNASQYTGRWIAKVRNDIVGHGGTPEQARHAAKAARHKETPEISFVPMTTPLIFSPVLNHILSAFPTDIPIYLVGGAVRDLLLSRSVHDYDFILPDNTLDISRQIANRIGAAYFPLDSTRGTARIIYTDQNGVRYILDFSTKRGPNLDSDLRDRDFTINAMALDIHKPHELLDPLGGASDLHKKLLRACTPKSLIDDPVRILRAIRMAANYGLKIDPNTRHLMRKAVPELPRISPERQRDEIIRILAGKQPHISILALQILDTFSIITPELTPLVGLDQSPPHIKDVWNHTIDTIRVLEGITTILSTSPDPEASGNLQLGILSMRLGRFREHIKKHLELEPVPGRSIKSLLLFAALYHDVAKPQTRTTDENGRIRYFNHDKVGAEIISQRAKAFRLSNIETDRLATIIRYHMRPSFLSHSGNGPSRRAVYRFFRDTGDSGVDICLLSLADVWATYGPTLPQDRWEKQVSVVRTLLEAWWEQPSEQIHPPSLISGYDIIDELGINPGPIIGDILEVIREAQVDKVVHTREEALIFIENYYKNIQSE
jgi:putative nucleotidyltransferase with HDIG domain